MAGLIGTAVMAAVSPVSTVAGLLATAKENNYQMTRLIAEVNNAFQYCQYLDDLLEDIEKHPKEYNTCSLKLFKKHKEELCEYINNEIIGSHDVKGAGRKGIMSELKAQTNELSEGTKILKAVEKLEKSSATKSRGDELQKIMKTTFVQKWPEWYRIEVATRVNNVQQLVDQLSFKSRGEKCQRIVPPVKLDLKPISQKFIEAGETDEEGDTWYDPEEEFDEITYAAPAAGGRNKRKHKKY